jgi:hypothetical protein
VGRADVAIAIDDVRHVMEWATLILKVQNSSLINMAGQLVTGIV